MTRRQTAYFESSARTLYAERATYFRRIEAIASDGNRRAEVDGYLQLIDNINRSLIDLSARFSGPVEARI
jgi:hypothetical protein